MILHPDEVPPAAVLIALGAGIVLFVGSSALAYWRLRHRILTRRIGLLAVLVLAVIAAGAMGLLPAWALAAVAAVLLVLVVVEEVRPPEPGSGHPVAAEPVVTG
jgi:hypothetical protein